jgi:hypothetical protein
VAVDFSISNHAAHRFVERVAPSFTIAEARAAIRSYAHGIEAAINIGCKCVRLPCGARLIIDWQGHEVVTVYAAEPRVNSIQHSGRGLCFNASRRKAKYGEDEDNG